MSPEQVSMKVRLGDIDLTDATFMSRLGFDVRYIAKLAENMNEFGQRNPVGLRRVGERYQIIYGWCRLKAAQLLGWELILARVYEGLTDLQAQLHNLSDNVTHDNLSLLEIAAQVRKLRDAHGLKVAEIAKLFDDKVQYVYDLLTLTEMREEIKKAVHLGRIGLTHAIEINKFPVSNQLETLEHAIKDGIPTSRLKRMRGLGIRSGGVEEASSRFSDEELEELAIQSEYRRFRRFLLGQVDVETVSQGSLEEEVESWIAVTEAMRSACGWGPANISERINTLEFTILRGRANPELESYAYMEPDVPLMNEELLELTGLRRDKPSREMLAWLIREGARFNALRCSHRWVESETGEYCTLCGISRHARLDWVDPPPE